MSETDLQLLRRYTRHRAEDAFAEVVRRHLDLVHSAAMRQVRSTELAEEVAQSVFIDLARQAHRLPPDTVLTAWLYQVTRRTAIDVVRREAGRRLREQVAQELHAMNATAADWTHIEPLLDEAMDALDGTDRTAVLLRYFENKSLCEVGQTLGTSDDAAQKRVSRAVERLREFLSKRGVTVGASGFIALLSANAVQAAPIGLAATIAGAALVAGTTIATTATLTNTIAMTTLQKTLVAGTLVAAMGAGLYEARQCSVLRNQVHTLQQGRASPVQQLEQERDDALSRLRAVETEMGRLRQDAAEILKLRAEVARLRAEARPTAQSKLNHAGPGGAVESVAKEWVDRVARLKQRLEQMPQARIPELQMLDEEDWLAVVKGNSLETENDYRRALSAVRNAGELKLASQMQKAVQAFMRNNNERFPTDLAQLQPYFDSPVDATILERWEIVPGKSVPNVDVGETIITQKTAIDDVFDNRLVVGSGGGLGGSDFLHRELFEVMQPVYEAYRAAHNRQWQTFAELEPYARTPEQQAALQKLILRNSGSK